MNFGAFEMCGLEEWITEFRDGFAEWRKEDQCGYKGTT